MKNQLSNKIDTNQKLLKMQINDLESKLLQNNKNKITAFSSMGRWHKKVMLLSNDYVYLKQKLDNYKYELDSYES